MPFKKIDLPRSLVITTIAGLLVFANGDTLTESAEIPKSRAEIQSLLSNDEPKALQPVPESSDQDNDSPANGPNFEKPKKRKIKSIDKYQSFDEIMADYEKGHLISIPDHLVSDYLGNSFPEEQRDLARLVPQQVHDVMLAINTMFTSATQENKNPLLYRNLRISSAIRTPATVESLRQNGNKNSIRNSDHLTGYAFDIDYSRYTEEQVADLLSYLTVLQQKGMITFVFEHHQTAFHVEVKPIVNYPAINQDQYLTSFTDSFQQAMASSELSKSQQKKMTKYREAETKRRRERSLFGVFKSLQEI